MLEVDVVGARAAPAGMGAAEVRRLCALVAAKLQIEAGHVAVHFVEPAQIAQLNAEHRGRREATDVLSFPIDGAQALVQPATRELGDIVICLEHTADVRAAIVHGMLHLMGMDHETDDGEMLSLQDELLARSARAPQ